MILSLITSAIVIISELHFYVEGFFILNVTVITMNICAISYHVNSFVFTSLSLACRLISLVVAIYLTRALVYTDTDKHYLSQYKA